MQHVPSWCKLPLSLGGGCSALGFWELDMDSKQALSPRLKIACSSQMHTGMGVKCHVNWVC